MKMGKINPKEKEFYDKLYNEVPEEIKSQYEEKCGIYALIRTDKDWHTDPTAILYVGQATNFVVRWVSHKTNALCPEARENWYTMYERMRETKASGIPMAFAVLEECSIIDLDEREEYYLRKYRPPFNYRLPAFDKERGWYERPQRHVTK